MKSIYVFNGSMILVLLVCATATRAEVLSSDAAGFQILIKKETKAETKDVYDAIVSDFSKWWDPAHSFSGEANNLSMDMEKGCMLEKLPNGGFVRHLEIVHCDPGKTLRLTGGLGPLQEMGVHGALTYKLVEADGKTEIQLVYNVVGFKGLQLDKVAPAVDRVLEEQAERLKKLCDSATVAGDGN